MPAMKWDQTGERYYETGVDHGALYLYDSDSNTFADGVEWNGLTNVTESPSGAEPNPVYADNIKYLNLMSAEEFGGTIEAFTYPDEFAKCDGSDTSLEGVAIGQQARSLFGFAYRTRVGNDTDQDRHGYKLHLIWNALAQPSEKAHATVNESPEAMSFSWTFSTTPIAFAEDGEFKDLRPTAKLDIDSRKAPKEFLTQLEEKLFGESRELPLPEEVLKMYKAAAGG